HGPGGTAIPGPQLRPPVLRRRHDIVSISRESRVVDPIAVLLVQRGLKLAGPGIPHPRFRVPPGRDHPPTVRAERGPRPHGTAQLSFKVTGLGIPDPRSLAAGHDRATVRTEGGAR